MAISMSLRSPATALSLVLAALCVHVCTGARQRLYIAADTVDCVGVSPRSCLQVARSRFGEFENFFSPIEGYSHRPGIAAVLDVFVTRIANPPVDGSSLRYRLLRLVWTFRGPRGRIQRLRIASDLVDCVGVGPRKCLQVSESAGGEFLNFFDTIDGFVRRPATSYVLDVAVTDVPNPPADGSSVRYKLVRVVRAGRGPRGRIERLYVQAETSECVGVGPRTCLQVATAVAGPFENFFDAIVGFSHKVGTSYVIDVAVTDVSNPPADGSSLRYELVRIVRSSCESNC